MTDDRTRHERLLARIAQGDRIEAGRDELGLPRQPRPPHDDAGRLRAGGAYGYVPWIMKAPGVEEKPSSPRSSRTRRGTPR